jgi:hypothetical protein
MRVYLLRILDLSILLERSPDDLYQLEPSQDLD